MALLETARTQADSVTLERLNAAAERGVDPEVTRDRLAALRQLVGDGIDRLEAQLPGLLSDAPPDVGAAAKHLLSAGGKRLRPLLLLLSARAAQPERAGRMAGSEAAFLMSVAAELVHNATLLHDDVIDDGSTRRGTHAARVLWGNAVSVLSGDFLLARALELIDQGQIPAALTSMLGVIRKMVEGEALQLDRRGKLDLDTDVYLRVIDAKTASLFSWCGRAGALAAGARGAVVEALTDYGFHLGRAFQIVDDVLDLSADAGALGKDLLSDLREGKLTLPVLLLLKSKPELAAELEKLAAIDDPPGEGVRAIADRITSEANDSGAIAAARAEAVSSTHLACVALRNVQPSVYRQALEQIAIELTERGC